MMIRIGITLLVLSSTAPGATLVMDSARGEALFTTLKCVVCHSVRGHGGKIGPDLGLAIDRNFTPARLASTMWNHAPTMWASMSERDVRAGDLNDQAAADLFAFFYSARFFEKPGDAGRGKSIFSAKHCAECHGLTKAILPAAKPVAEWQSMSRPVALVAAMWNHAATMQKEFTQRNIPWPTLTSQDLTDLQVYVRNLPGTLHQPDLLLLNSGENGQVLFESKKCAGCHTGTLALERRLRGQTLTGIAVDMWNHAPRMAGAAPALDAQEMRDLVSYLWAQQFFEDSGRAAAGQRVFTKKHCVVCHDDASSGAPKLTGRREPFTGSAMVSALWRHGPKMLSKMKAKGISWPRFDGAEMANLIAYLNSLASAK